MIRLQRVGRRNDPSFRVVITDSRNSTKSGKFVEIVGNYDARKTKAELNKERILHWIKNGARTSDTMHNLLISNGVITGKKINVSSKSKIPAGASEPKAEAKTETPAS